MKMHAAICRRDRTWCYPKACTISLWRKAMLCRSMAWGRSRFIGSDSAVSKVRFIIDPVRGSILVQLFVITVTYLMGKPHSPPCKGGVAAPLIKCCEATKAAQTGVVVHTRCFKNAFRNVISERPPLLCKEGNTLSLTFVTVIYEPRYLVSIRKALR